MRDIRNILTHNYFEIDFDIVCLAIEQELPILKQAIAAILRSFQLSVRLTRPNGAS